MAIDWRMDTEKRLNNLVRFIRQDVIARGDADALLDEPSVTQNTDGSYTVKVFKADDPPLDPPPAPTKTRKRKKANAVEGRPAPDEGEE